MMKRRDFISLINAIWVSLVGLFLSQNKVKAPSTSTFTREISLSSGERFELPSDAWNGFSVKLVVNHQSHDRAAIVSCYRKHSIENQTREIEMDVNGTYIFTFSKPDRFWAVERVQTEVFSNSLG